MNPNEGSQHVQPELQSLLIQEHRDVAVMITDVTGRIVWANDNTLINNADQAMFRAKLGGGQRHAFFEQDHVRTEAAATG